MNQRTYFDDSDDDTESIKRPSFKKSAKAYDEDRETWGCSSSGNWRKQKRSHTHGKKKWRNMNRYRQHA